MRIRARDRHAVIPRVTAEDRAVLAAEDRNMRWEDWIAKTVAEAPPLSSEQIEKLRVLFGYAR